MKNGKNRMPGRLSVGVLAPGGQPNLWLLHLPGYSPLQGTVGLKFSIATALLSSNIHENTL